MHLPHDVRAVMAHSLCQPYCGALRLIETSQIMQTFDLDHREPAPLGTHPVALPGQFLLAGQQRLALDELLVARSD